MTNSEHGSDQTPASGAGDSSGADGLWGLQLWNGSAWFSDWFYHRLEWPPGVKRKRLEDLRSHLSVDSWQALLLAIRNHLECAEPLDAKLQVQLPNGRVEWWQVAGAVERSVGGQPVHLAGRMRDITAERAGESPPGGPKTP
jgi:PAS domain-containing protein